MEDRVGWVFTFADFQHPLERFLALRVIRAGFQNDGKLVCFLIRPFADLPLLAVRAVLADDGRNRSLNGAELDQSRTARPGLFSRICRASFPSHLDFDVQAYLIPHSTRICAVGVWLV